MEHVLHNESHGVQDRPFIYDPSSHMQFPDDKCFPEWQLVHVILSVAHYLQEISQAMHDNPTA